MAMIKETMQSTIIGTPDLLSTTCAYLTTVQEIYMFSITNKRINTYLTKTSTGLQHWEDAGHRTCGSKYWREPGYDIIYHTMLQICPWLSTPSTFPIIPALATQPQGRTRRSDILELTHRIDENDEDDTMLCMKIATYSTDPTQETLYELNAPSNSQQYKNYTQYDTYSQVDEHEIRDFYKPQECDNDIIPELSAERWDRHLGNQTMLQDGNILKVHDGVFAAVKSDNTKTKILFTSYKTHKVLRTITIERCSPRCIVTAPGGKMWCASSFGRIHFFGPRDDKKINYDEGMHPSVRYVELTQKYWDALDGKLAESNGEYLQNIHLINCLVSSGTAALKSLMDRWPNFVREIGSKALITAVENKDLDTVSLLVKAKVKPPSTILFHYMARSYKHLHHSPVAISKVPPSTPAERRCILQLLLAEAKADPNARLGGSPVICEWARDYEGEAGFFSMLPMLLQHGCNINAASVRGRTALMIAADRDSIGKFTALLQHDADPTIPDADGVNVFDYIYNSPERRLTFGFMIPTVLEAVYMHRDCKERMAALLQH